MEFCQFLPTYLLNEQVDAVVVAAVVVDAVVVANLIASFRPTTRTMSGSTIDLILNLC